MTTDPVSVDANAVIGALQQLLSDAHLALAIATARAANAEAQLAAAQAQPATTSD